MDQGILRAMCTSVPGRYAKALFDVAQKKGMLEKTAEECDMALDLLSKRYPYRFLFVRILQERMPDLWLTKLEKIAHFQDFFFNFLKLLVRNNRMGFLSDIVRLFKQLVDEEQQRASLTVFSTEILSGKQKEMLVTKLQRIFKKDLNMTYEVDPSILGGIVVQSNSLIIDISVKHQIEKFISESKEYFTMANYGER